MSQVRWCPRHEGWSPTAQEWTPAAHPDVPVVTLGCGCTLPVNSAGKCCLSVLEARRSRPGRKDGPRRPTFEETNPGWRAQMRDSGHGGMLT